MKIIKLADYNLDDMIHSKNGWQCLVNTKIPTSQGIVIIIVAKRMDDSMFHNSYYYHVINQVGRIIATDVDDKLWNKNIIEKWANISADPHNMPLAIQQISPSEFTINSPMDTAED